MIEIEKKFHLTIEEKKRVEKMGVFQKKVLFQDTYFDTEDYTFTKQNIWLRKRNDYYLVKRGVSVVNGSIDRFEEISDGQKIMDLLDLPMSSSLERSIEKRGLLPYCSFTNVRQKYLVDEFLIDIDEAMFSDDFSYQIAEIELLVQDESDIKIAENKIFEFAKSIGLNIDRIAKPKLIAYLAKIRPKHFKALVDAKVTYDFKSDELFIEEK